MPGNIIIEIHVKSNVAIHSRKVRAKLEFDVVWKLVTPSKSLLVIIFLLVFGFVSRFISVHFKVHVLVYPVGHMCRKLCGSGGQVCHQVLSYLYCGTGMQ